MDETTRRQVEAAATACNKWGTDEILGALLQAQALNRIADALEGLQAPSGAMQAPRAKWHVPKYPELLADAPEPPQDAPRAPQPPQGGPEAPAAAPGGSPWRVAFDGAPEESDGCCWCWKDGRGATRVPSRYILPGEHYAIGIGLRPTTPPPAVAGGWTEYRRPVEAEGPFVLIPVGNGTTVATIDWNLVVEGQPWAPAGSNPGPWPF